MLRRYVVTSGYESAYPEPLAAREGDRLTRHTRESEWPGRVWCAAATGAAGRVPPAWVRSDDDGSCTLLRDYTAREPTVESGQVVTASFVGSGWTWATNGAGDSGWVPLEPLAPE